MLGLPFDARRAADLGFVTQVVPDQNLLATANETARKLAAKPAGALQASKRLMKRSFREQIKAAMKAENEEFSAQVRSEDAKEALTAFLEKRAPHFAERWSPQRPRNGEAKGEKYDPAREFQSVSQSPPAAARTAGCSCSS